jgi:hypothetical protein
MLADTEHLSINVGPKCLFLRANRPKAMTLRFTSFELAKGFVESILEEMQRPIAKAATAAVRKTGEIAKRTGRASIAAAGFFRKWQNALRVNIYPPQGERRRPGGIHPSQNSVRWRVRRRRGHREKPLLWLPLPKLPLRSWTPPESSGDRLDFSEAWRSSPAYDVLI